MTFGRKNSDWDSMVEQLRKMQKENAALKACEKSLVDALKTIANMHVDTHGETYGAQLVAKKALSRDRGEKP